MTPERNILATNFLAGSGWGTAVRTDLAGDASMRRYERLRAPSGETAILMDASPETNTDISPFVTVAQHLTGIGLSAPQIFGEDTASGFLLLEDLGDDLFTRIIPDAPKMERPLYRAATDLLITLHQSGTPSLTLFGPELMAEQASLVFDTWVAAITGTNDTGVSEVFRARFQDLLFEATQGEPVMILRDYHAENLIWLPDRSGVARVGLLDFQDAMLAHPAYDLVSLLQDVRRDVPAAVEQAMVDRYLTHSGQDDHDFRTAYVVLGVQRNLRILAVFARLASTYGKPFYANLIPRTWAHLMRGLEHPALAPIASTLNETLPRPTASNLQKLVPV